MDELDVLFWMVIGSIGISFILWLIITLLTF